MSDDDILALKAAVANPDLQVIWNPDRDVGRIVTRVGKAAPTDGDEPEPSEVAFFSDGTYAALYNCPAQDFVVGKPLTNWWNSLKPEQQQAYRQDHECAPCAG